MKYQHLFFDLDHTLWDFERNASETLSELHGQYLDADKIPCEAFLTVFHRVNAHLWHLFDTQKISAKELRESRFEIIFAEFEIKNKSLAQQLGDLYLEQSPRKQHLLPYTQEVLDYLKHKYHLHIITNGFPEVQRIKMQSGKIFHYFKEIITSQEAGCKKPDTRIFDFLVEKLDTDKQSCLMVGDNAETDIGGALAAGLDCVLFNPKKMMHSKTPTYEIACLSDLKAIL